MEQVELNVKLEEQDFLKANYWFIFGRYSIFIKLMIFIALFIPLFFFFYEQIVMNFNVPGLLIGPMLIMVILLSKYSNFKKDVESNRALLGPLHYSLSNNGIDINSPSTSSHTKWSNIFQAKETKENFLLFISRQQIYLIPKRSFQNDQEIDSFRMILKSNLASKAKLK
jgi:hypothetical protein